MAYLFGILAVLLCACELTGWNLDNFVMFSPIALWLCPAILLATGYLGGWDFYRRSRTARGNDWYVQRHVQPGKWRFRLFASVASSMLLGGGSGVYVLAVAATLLPSTPEMHRSTIVYEGTISTRPPPLCREYRLLQSIKTGQFTVCIRKLRGRTTVVNPRASLHAGAVVNVTVRTSVLGAWAVRIDPAGQEPSSQEGDQS